MFRRIGRAFRIVAAALCALLLAGVVAERAADRILPFPIERLYAGACGGEALAAAPSSAEWATERPLDHFAPNLIAALVAAEDSRFYEHDGVDVLAAMRSLALNVRRGRVVSGASTLTMQLARIAEPREKCLAGKLVEALRARQIERSLPKDEILERYLNVAPLGSGARGFEAAAWLWFGKSASDLEVDEAATLVALLPAPERRAPDRDPESLTAARDRVLERMLARGDLEPKAYEAARARPLTARRHALPSATLAD